MPSSRHLDVDLLLPPVLLLQNGSRENRYLYFYQVIYSKLLIFFQMTLKSLLITDIVIDLSHAKTHINRSSWMKLPT